MKVIFLGTPDFAVASLEAILKSGHQVLSVVTSPDKPAGRGQKLQESAVKKFALSQRIPVLQPTNLKNEEFLHQLKVLNADIQVVVAFRMLPEVVWSMPPKGTVNLHASLLPQFRGAAPINHAIIQGEKVTGVSTFLLQHEIDTGNILLSESVEISDDETAGELHDQLMVVGSRLLVETLYQLENGTLEGKPQEQVVELKKAPKLSKEFCEIKWDDTVVKINNHIRGLSPYPAAFTFLKDKKVKIYKIRIINEQPDIKNGNYTTDHKTFLRFAAGDGYIDILELQMEGKKRMSIGEFLRGAKL